MKRSLSCYTTTPKGTKFHKKKVINASLSQNQRLQCVSPLTHARKPRRAMPLSNDAMIQLGDVQYQTKPNLSPFFLQWLNQRLLQFLFANSFNSWLSVWCFFLRESFY